MRLRKLSIALAASAIGAAALGAVPALGADHKDAPITKTDGQSDINDLYVFKGTATAGVVLAMTVNPLTTPPDTAGTGTGGGTRLHLGLGTVYEFKIDTNGDAVPDLSYKVTAKGTGGAQDITLKKATASDAVTDDDSGVVIASGKSSMGSAVTTITGTGGEKLYVGPRDDPFFFDLGAFNAGLAFQAVGVDTFKGTNITAIVLELPQPPATNLGVWATTAKNGVQFDRMGRPGILTIFVPPTVANTNGDLEDAYNQNTPDRDKAIFKATFVETLNNIAAFLNITAKPELADVLLPDILTADLSKPIGYLNGRAPVDDVIDGSLQVITGIAGLGDGVPANDKAFPATFPYLADPHGVPGAPAAPSTGSGLQADNGEGVMRWSLPAGLIAAAALLGAAGFVASRRERTERV